MSPAEFNNDNANAWNENIDLNNDNVDNNNGGVRPVINLMTDNGFASGNGTVSSPYVVN